MLILRLSEACHGFLRERQDYFQLIVLAIALLSGTPVVEAHLPEVFGREFVRVEPEAPVSGEWDRDRAESTTAEDLEQHEDHLEAVERMGGPYAIGLADPLVNLALHHQQRGDLDDAIQYYRRALHLVRVNDGLYSELQLPILRNLITLYRQHHNQAALGDLYHYYGRVLKLGESPLTLNRSEAALEYLRWERELYATRLDGMERIHLARAYRVNEALLSSFTPATASEREVYYQLAFSQMRNLYLILGDAPLSQLATLQSAATLEADRAERSMAWIQKVGLARGRQIMEACKAIAADEPAPVRARFYLELGDWYQWNEQLRRSRKEYLQVVSILREAGEEELLTQWLGQPMELPDEGDLWGRIGHTDDSGATLVEASYGVSATGAARAVEVSVSDDLSAGHALRVKRMLQDTHFRPRYSDDGPVRADRVTRHYQLVGVR